MIKFNFQKLLIPVAAIISLSACDQGVKSLLNADSEISSCSSITAVDLIKKEIPKATEDRARADNKGKDENARLDLSKIRATLAQVKFDVTDIITSKTDPNSTKKFCEATMTIAIDSSSVRKADELRLQNGQQSIKSIAEDADFKVDANKYSKKISYNVQPTDDGQKIVVSVDDSQQYIDLVSEAVLWAIAGGNQAAVQTTTPVTSTPAPAPAAPTAAAPVEVTPSSEGDSSLFAELEQSSQLFHSAEREINVIWKALPKYVRDANLAEQRNFNHLKESMCFKQAAKAGEGIRFEIAKNYCWAELYNQRIKQLKTLM